MQLLQQPSTYCQQIYKIVELLNQPEGWIKWRLKTKQKIAPFFPFLHPSYQRHTLITENFVSMKVSKIRGDETVKGWKQLLKQRNISVCKQAKKLYFSFFFSSSIQKNLIIYLF